MWDFSESTPNKEKKGIKMSEVVFLSWSHCKTAAAVVGLKGNFYANAKFQYQRISSPKNVKFSNADGKSGEVCSQQNISRVCQQNSILLDN